MKPIIPERLKQAREQAWLSVGQAVDLVSLPRSIIEILEDSDYMEQPTPKELKTFIRVYDVNEAWLRGEEKPLVLPPDFAAFLERMSPDERDSLIDLLSSMRQNES